MDKVHSTDAVAENVTSIDLKDVDTDKGQVAIPEAVTTDDFVDLKSTTEAVTTKTNRSFRLITAISAILLVVIISLVGIVIHLSDRIDTLNQALMSLDQKTADTFDEKQAQLDGLNTSIDGVRSDMEAGFESQQEQIDKQKNVQHNTIAALTRTNKQIAEKESEIQELRDQIKK